MVKHVSFVQGPYVLLLLCHSNLCPSPCLHWLFLFSLIWKNFKHIFSETNISSIKYLGNYFSHFVHYVFLFIMVSLYDQKYLNINKFVKPLRFVTFTSCLRNPSSTQGHTIFPNLYCLQQTELAVPIIHYTTLLVFIYILPIVS